MAMGKKERQRQEELWLATSELPKTPGHPFYQALNRVFDEHGFDDFVEGRCGKFYAEKMGRPSLAPGIYFRMMLVGYFEGIGSERGIAWRVADSLALREFLGLKLSEPPPDHSTLSRTRRLMDVETHAEVFGWVLKRLHEEELLEGKTIGVDATTLEANAALRSIVRRDTGESYQDFLIGLAEASGIETPTREDLVRVDRKRPKKGSNEEWKHPHDPDSRITKMKDGRTHLAHKAEHAVDMKTGAIVAVTVQGADQGDTKTLIQTLTRAAENIEEASRQSQEMTEVVADKGYHSTETVKDFQTLQIRSYISEPKRGRRKWKGDIEGRDATYANRRRLRGSRGIELLRRRGEKLERAFAHLYRKGALRRTEVRGHENIAKRLLLQAGAFNLGLVMRKMLGAGTPRALHARILYALLAFFSLKNALGSRIERSFQTWIAKFHFHTSRAAPG
jgi:transposase